MSRQEFGDWQTPIELARAAIAVVARKAPEPRVVLEPTCGEGTFLVAVSDHYPHASLLGFEINEGYAEQARARLPAERTRIDTADFFSVDWDSQLAELPEPILVVGNPPWVTNAILGAIGSKNLPEKRNFKGLGGYDACTGKSNFDVSEWMILRILEALRGRNATLAVLCKAVVARRVIEFSAAHHWPLSSGGLWPIDAMRHFRAAVDAVLFVCSTDATRPADGRWPVYSALEAEVPSSTMAVVDGTAVVDTEMLGRTAHLVGTCEPEWRSGLKHDCSRVMELTLGEAGWLNGFGELVDIEEERLFPLLKGSDVAKGLTNAERAVVVPQRALGEDTSSLREQAPRTWAYLCSHRERFQSRKSSIYRGQPDFAIFGVGPYSFAPWKVAVSGLHKRCEFTLVGPRTDKPVMLDDTCYFLPFATADEATAAWQALRSPLAHDFLTARVFWDAKRPLNKTLLQKLNLGALRALLGAPSEIDPV